MLFVKYCGIIVVRRGLMLVDESQGNVLAYIQTKKSYLSFRNIVPKNQQKIAWTHTL